MARPRGRFGKFFGGAATNAAGYAAGTATGDTLRPGLQELVNLAWETHPVLPLSGQLAAEGASRHLWTEDAAEAEGRLSGYDAHRMDLLRRLTATQPALDVLIDLWRRGKLEPAEFDAAVKRLGYEDKWLDELRALKHRLLTPEQAAAAVERGELSYEAAEDIAALSGADAEAFRVIERLAGLAPSTEQLISLRRRGAIDDARMRKGFIQGNVRSEWSEELAKLADVLLTPGELARIVVEGVMPEDDAARLAQVVGVNPENFHRLVRIAGSAPAADRLLNLWNRGQISEADVDRGLKQQGVKDEWIEDVKSLRKHLPSASDAIRFAVKDVFDPAVVARFGLDEEFPAAFLPLARMLGIDEEQAHWYWQAHWRNVSPTQLYRMLHRGLITEDDLERGLKVADYSPFWREKLAAISRAVPGRIDLRRFLAAGIIDRAEVKRGYQRLGFTEQVAEWQTQLAEQLAAGGEGGGSFVQKAQTQLWTTAHRSFISGESTPAQAKTKLGQAGVPTGERDAVIATWTNERELIRKQLTAAQVKKAYLKAVKNQTTGLPWTRDDALAALVERGYSSNDANEFLDL